MTIKVTVLTTPANGKPTTQEVELDPTGASVAEVLAKAGFQVGDMQISIDGKPLSNEDLHVKDGAKIVLSQAKQVERTERGRGS